MKTLTIPSSGIVLGDTGTDLLLLNSESFFRRSRKFASVGLPSAGHRNIQPIFCLSSKPQVNLDIADTESQDICNYRSNTVHVKFQIQKECSFGDELLLIGDDPMFGLWDPDNGIPLTWSEGHVWAVEVDMPIGKTIQFKFVVKESSGTITWQPGPDRTFQSWESKKTITVCEEWEDAELQKLIEDDGCPFPNQNEDYTVDSEVLAVAEKLTCPKEELVYGTTEELVFTHSFSSQEVKGVAIVADNIGNPKKGSGVNAANEFVDGGRNGDARKENVAMGEMIAKGVLGKNGGVAEVNSRSTEVDDEDQMTCEGAPVLVPGLTSFSAVVENEEAVQVGGNFGIADGHAELLKQKIDESHQGTTETFSDKEEHDAGLEEGFMSGKEEVACEEGVERHDKQPLLAREEEE